MHRNLLLQKSFLIFLLGTFTFITAWSQNDIQLVNDATLGQVLTDASGNTLYYFTKDSEPNASACMGGCVDAWPIFHVSTPTVGAGLDPADFGSFMRSDGVMQTTYQGWPLYYFVNDTAAGDTNGEGVNNIWYVAKPDYGIMLMNDTLVGLDGMTYNSNYELGSEEVQYFVDAQGRTLYVWVNDNFEQNNFTAEDFSNNGAWPIYEEDLQQIPSDLDASLFSTIDVFGRQQLTYQGWPLYYFGQDAQRGDTKGVSVPIPGIWPLAIKDLEEAPQAENIKLSEDASLGQVLTDASGNTLYYFTKDSEPNASACMGGCVDAWPIFHVSTPTVGAGLDPADFGSFMRSDGVMQTTYQGWPLYYFVNDTAAGDTNGEGVNNIWYVAKPDYGIMLMNDTLVGLDGMTYNSNYELGSEEVQYFVDAQGRTLYVWVNDNFEQNNFTAEDFSNNGAWPIYEEDLQQIPSDLDASLFSTIDVFGRQQLTYQGWPLYYFGQDAQRGDTKGVSVPMPGIWPVAVPDLEPALVDAVTEITSISEAKVYPNPVGEQLNLSLELSTKTFLTISLYNVVGQPVRKLWNGMLKKGPSNLALSGLEDLSEGIYFLILVDQAGRVNSIPITK